MAATTISRMLSVVCGLIIFAAASHTPLVLAADVASEGNTSSAVQATPEPLSPSPLQNFYLPPKPTVQYAGYLGLGGKVQQLLGKTAFFGSLHGGWIINQAYLGLGIYMEGAPVYQLHILGQDQKIMLFCGGVEGGYLQPLDNGLTLRGQLLLGLTSMDYNNTGYNNRLAIISNDSILIEPGVYLDMEMWHDVGLSFGVHYHFTQGAEGPEGVNQSDFNQPGAEVMFKWSGF